MRPEPVLTPECCRELAAGGALSFAVGIESGSRRILKRINKGIRREAIESAVENLSAAGIAVEWMCFTHFPGETLSEALETLRVIEAQHNNFALLPAAVQPGLRRQIACRPQDYGINDVWQVAGDDFIKTFLPVKDSFQNIRRDDRTDAFIHDLSRRYWFHDYPRAGSFRPPFIFMV
jgi:hypothetical protein